MTDPAEAQKTASNLMTRGTDRVRRRAQQAAAKQGEIAEAAALVSPSGPEKDAAIKAAKVKQVEKGTTSKEVRERKQAANKEAEVVEVALLGSLTHESPLAAFKEGQQVDHVTARRLMKQMNSQSRDENRTAALEAGRAVRNVLDGRRPAGASRARRAAKHAAAAAGNTN